MLHILQAASSKSVHLPYYFLNKFYVVFGNHLAVDRHCVYQK